MDYAELKEYYVTHQEERDIFVNGICVKHRVRTKVLISSDHAGELRLRPNWVVKLRDQDAEQSTSAEGNGAGGNIQWLTLSEHIDYILTAEDNGKGFILEDGVTIRVPYEPNDLPSGFMIVLLTLDDGYVYPQDNDGNTDYTEVDVRATGFDFASIWRLDEQELYVLTKINSEVWRLKGENIQDDD